jgi:uncharacterized membrane protein required for colicin V production
MPLLDIAIIIVIALIAYWWSNQGFLSGLLHLVCVITAGALALAWWEPIVVNYLLSKSWWSGLMPGTAMLVTFIIALTLLRMISDKLAFGNTRLPRPVDMVGGGILGLLSGVLTTGLLLLGVGFIDQPQQILGHTGWYRNQEGQVTGPGTEDGHASLWLPVDAWTTQFYELLSLGVLHPDISDRPLANWNPNLDQLASLLRDRISSKDGKSSAQMFQPRDSIEISKPVSTSIPEGDGQVMMIPMSFQSEGMDFGKELVLASSQLRLVGSSQEETVIIYPTFWGQLFRPDLDRLEDDLQKKFEEEKISELEMNAELDMWNEMLKAAPGKRIPGLFRFESTDSYIVETDEKTADIRLLFLIPDDFKGHFLQVRGTRFDLEKRDQTDDWDQFCIQSGIPPKSAARLDPWGGDISKQVDQRGRLAAGGQPDRSAFKGDVVIDEDSGRITRANAAQYPNRSRGKGNLRTKGYGVLIQDPSVSNTQRLIRDPNRNVVKIAVGPTTDANILAAARFIGGDGDIVLYDTYGGEYSPRGFELTEDTTTTITFDMPIRRWSDITHRPSFGSDDRFSLIFILPVSITLDRLELGDEVIGLFVNETVKAPSGR